MGNGVPWATSVPYRRGLLELMRHCKCRSPPPHYPLTTLYNNHRAFKKKLDCGEPSKGMTSARAAQLEPLGFAWELLKGPIWWRKRYVRRA